MHEPTDLSGHEKTQGSVERYALGLFKGACVQAFSVNSAASDYERCRSDCATDGLGFAFTR